MATREIALPHVPAAHVGEATGLRSWLTTVDHKRIGILYGVSAFFFFLLGGIEALLIRLQLAVPGNTLVTGDAYNALFTMHGTTMVFLAIMPFNNAFINYVIPLMIGARDVAFPRLNALSFWIFFFGGLFLNASFLAGTPPDTGWFGYANLTLREFTPSISVDFWLLSLQILGASSIIAAVNFIVTILNMRAPGMRLMRMPLFVWMTLVVQFLIAFAFPPITVGLIFLMFDRFFGTHFYNVAAGGDLHLWQHLFWIFGHPEVYILILPAFGIVSEVLPVFARKPLFGAPVVIYSGVLIGFFGFGVWGHHMFAAGMGPIADSAFSIATMLIAIPTGVKIFNWLATLWGGSIRPTTALHFAVGLIATFTIGGLSGVMHASPPVDLQQTDTYFVVAHFHYVLIGGSLFGLFAGAFYWWPKITGRLLDERLGRVTFWVMFIGFNLAFFPQHYLGAIGMPRRIFTYHAGLGWEFWNLMSTIGAFGIALAVAMFAVNWWRTMRGPATAGGDPWDGRTLEWRTSSPPPVHDFDEIPPVYSRDTFWREKHGRVPATTAAVPVAHDGHGIHVPAPSHWPIVVAAGIVLAAVGALYTLTLVLVGAAIAVIAIFRFALEHHRDPAYVVQVGDLGIDQRKIGMWTFLGSECFLFGSLIATYLAYKGRSVVGPEPGEVFNLQLTTLSTFDLLMSSLLMVLALAAVQRGDHRGSRLWLAGTALFGIIFLGFQAYEFTTFITHDGLTLQQNLFGSTFYVLTGFHGGHVAIGVLWLLTLLVLDLRGKLGPQDSTKVEIAGLYWHFVDVVWIAIFTLVYLVP